MSEPVAPQASSCPSCDADLLPNAVICIKCGFDTRTGKKLGDEAGKAKPEKAKSASSESSDLKHNLRRLPLKIAGIALSLVVAYFASYPVRAFFKDFRKLAKEGVKPLDLSGAPTDEEGVRRAMELPGGGPRPSGPRPGGLRPQRSEAAKAAYKKWKAASKVVVQKSRMLTVSGPGFAVPAVVDGLEASPLWAEIVTALGKASPNAFVSVRARVTDGLPVSRPDSQASKNVGRALHLDVLLSRVNPKGSALAAEYFGYPPDSTGKLPVGLPASFAAKVMASQDAVKRMSSELPCLSARIAAKLLPVAKRVSPQMQQWLTGGDADQQCCACAFYQAQGTNQQAVLGVLGKLLDSEDAAQRQQALSVIFSYEGKAAAALFPRILRLPDHGDRYVRERTADYLAKRVLGEEHIPFLLPAVESGGSAGRMWLLKALMAPKPRLAQSVRQTTGKVALAALAAEKDTAVKAEIVALMKSPAFVSGLGIYTTHFSNDQLLPFLASSEKNMSTVAANVLKGRVNRGGSLAGITASLQEMMTEREGHQAFGAWQVLGTLAAKGTGREHAAALTAYRQGWVAFVGGNAKVVDWPVGRRDLGRAVKLVHRDNALLKPVLLYMLDMEDLSIHELSRERRPQFPQGPPSGLTALLLAMDWARLDAAARMAGAKYMMRGIQSQDASVSVPVARVFLEALRCRKINRARTQRQPRAHLEQCEKAAWKVLIGAFRSPDLRTRRQVVGLAGRVIPSELLQGHADVIAQIIIDTVEAADPKAVQDEARRVMAPYKSNAQRATKSALEPPLKNALEESSLSAEEKRKVGYELR